MARPVRFVGSNESGDDEMTCSHTDSSSKQNRLATELVDIEQSWDREQKFDHADNTGRQKSQCVAVESKASENEGCTV